MKLFLLHTASHLFAAKAGVAAVSYVQQCSAADNKPRTTPTLNALILLCSIEIWDQVMIWTLEYTGPIVHIDIIMFAWKFYPIESDFGGVCSKPLHIC